MLLARWQIVPELISDGLEAVLHVGEQEFDLLLMDIEMPVLDGLMGAFCADWTAIPKQAFRCGQAPAGVRSTL